MQLFHLLQGRSLPGDTVWDVHQDDKDDDEVDDDDDDMQDNESANNHSVHESRGDVEACKSKEIGTNGHHFPCLAKLQSPMLNST